MPNVYERYFGLANRRALVTGAGKGIGASIATALAAVGAEVLIHYHSSHDAAQDLVETIQAQGGTAWVAQADLTDAQQVETFFQQVQERWDALDIVVNNTGDLVKRCPIEQFSDELMESVLKVNVHSAVYVTRAAIPLLRKGVKPSIINLSSVAAHTGGGNGAVLYAATKGAIHTFTRGMAKELAPDIRVNGIAPGFILTDFHRRNTPEPIMQSVVQNTPLKRLGEPDEIAAAAIFLCGDGAAFITGEVIEINGGQWVA
jgi:3-oxoacyl-[acyl-carrier protein] reductase